MLNECVIKMLFVLCWLQDMVSSDDHDDEGELSTGGVSGSVRLLPMF